MPMFDVVEMEFSTVMLQSTKLTLVFVHVLVSNCTAETPDVYRPVIQKVLFSANHSNCMPALGSARG